MEAVSLNTSDSYTLQDYNEEMRQAVMPVTVVTGIECVAGVVGNLTVLIVFTWFYKPSNFRYFVLCLCVTDLLCSLTTIPFEMVTHTYWFTYPSLELCKTKSFLNMFTVCSECQCLFVIAIDRYRKICRPHGWQISHKAAMCLCCGLYVISVALSVPVPFFWGLHTESQVYNNVTMNVTKCEKDQRFLYSSIPQYYTYTIYVIIGVVLLIMFVLYMFVARVLFKHNKQTQHHSATSLNNGRAKQRTVPLVSIHGNDYYHGIYLGPTQSLPRNSELESDSDSFDGNPVQNNTETPSSSETTDNQTSSANGNNRTQRLDGPREENLTTLRKRPKKFHYSARRKTLITLILTIIFLVTTVLYLALLLLITMNFLAGLSFTERSVYFFFFRLYFINHVINPIVYGILDPQFKRIVKQFVFIAMRRCMCRDVSVSISSITKKPSTATFSSESATD